MGPMLGGGPGTPGSCPSDTEPFRCSPYSRTPSTGGSVVPGSGGCWHALHRPPHVAAAGPTRTLLTGKGLWGHWTREVRECLLPPR